MTVSSSLPQKKIMAPRELDEKERYLGFSFWKIPWKISRLGVIICFLFKKIHDIFLYN